MPVENGLKTAIMARIFTQQGHYRRAADIYRFLLRQDPNRKDLLEELADVERLLEKKNAESGTHLGALFEEWITLLLRYRQVKQLERLKKDL